MAGLIANNMPEKELPGDPSTPDGTPAHENAEAPGMEQQEQAQGPEQDDSDVSEEDQVAYKRFMLAVKKALYVSKLAENFAEHFQQDANLSHDLANFTYMLVAEIDHKSKGMLPAQLLAAAAFDTLGLLCEIAKAAGQPVDGQSIAKACQEMLQRFFRENGATDEEVKGLMGGAQLDQAAQSIESGQGEQAAPPPGATQGGM